MLLVQRLDDLTEEIAARRDLAERFDVQRVSPRCTMLVDANLEHARGPVDFEISETSLAWAMTDDDVDSGWDDAASQTA